MKVLLVTMYWPPAGGGGVPRPLKLATFLPELGIETHVLAPADPKRMHRDDSLVEPPQATVHRVRNLAPRVHRPGPELHAARGPERHPLRAALTAGGRKLPEAARATIAGWMSGAHGEQLGDAEVRAHQRLLREFLGFHLHDVNAAGSRSLRALDMWERAGWSAA